MTQERQEVRIGFNREAAISRLNDYNRWKENPSAYEKKETITPQEFERVLETLEQTFGDKVRHSGLASEVQSISEDDLLLAHNINKAMLDIQEEIIPDAKRRSWNKSTFQHVTQVEATTWEIAERIGLDTNLLRVKAAHHDLGRAASNDPVIHLLAGRDLLKRLGFSHTFQRTAIAHGEAGVGAYMYGVDEHSWPAINADSNLLKQAVDELPIEEVVIAVADMSKRSYVKDGEFINEIADSFTGLASAAKRRLTTTHGEPDDSVLVDLGNTDARVRQQAMQTLRDLGASEDNVNKMAMYYGWMSALRNRLETEYGVEFSGETGVIKSAKKRYEEMMKTY